MTVLSVRSLALRGRLLASTIALVLSLSAPAYADVTLDAGVTLFTGSSTPDQGTTAGGTTVRTTSIESLLALAEDVALQATLNLLGLVSVSVDGTPTLADIEFGGVPTPGPDIQESLFTVRSVTPAHGPGTVPVDLVYLVVVKAQLLLVTETVNVTVRLRLNNGYTYIAPHTVSSVTPSTGPEAGGTVVTFTGANFRSGMTALFGASAATGILVNSPTSMTAVSPAGLGTVAVTLSNADGEQVVLPNAFTYTPAVIDPTVSSVTPSSGPINGGTAVVVTGTGFLPGAVVTVGGVAATSVVVSNSTQLSAVVPSAPAGAGAYAVMVTNTDGGSGTYNSYTYQPQSTPTISSVVPPSGPTTGGISTEIVGTGFNPGATVTMCGQTVTPTQVSATSLVFLTPACGTAGPTAITVTNPDGGAATAPGAYTFTAAPVVASVSPSTGTVAGGTLVTITGTGFQPGATVVFDASPATGVVVVGPTSILAQTPAHAAGPVAVRVNNPDGGIGVLADAYVYAVVSAPTITLVTPPNGVPGTVVTLDGTQFQNGATVTMCAVVVPTTFFSAAQVSFEVPLTCVDGPQDITLTNPDGGTATAGGGFNVGVNTSSPVVASVSPTSGPATGGTTISVSGTGFLAGATVTVDGVAATAVQVVNSTLVTAITPAGTVGAVDVTLLNPDSGTSTLPGGFTYLAQSVPTITGLAPSAGPTTGGVGVLISGTGFQPGATVTFDGVAAPVSQVSTGSVAVTSPECTAGLQTVIVTNPDGGSATAVDAFACQAVSQPSASGIVPGLGSVSGGTPIQISGSGFAAGATVTIGAAPVAGVMVPSEAVITGVTTAHAAGTYDVTIVNPDGGTVTLASAFTYLSTACPATPDDADGDCLPDDWEREFGLDPTSGVCPDGAACDPDNDGRTNLEEHGDGTHPRGFYRQYFAEGVLSDLFATHFEVVAPSQGSGTAHVQVRYLLQGGASVGQDVSETASMPEHSMRTFDPASVLGSGSHEFATVIESDVQVAASRSVTWDATSYGSHMETAVATPSTSWHFAEGATIAGFNLFYLLSNPAPESASVTMTYWRPHPLSPIVRTHAVPGNSRVTVWVNLEAPELVSEEMSTSISSTRPILAERAMYRDTDGQLFTSGHAAAGTTAPERSWFFAEGATGAYFDTFLLVSNPYDVAVNIQASYLLPTGVVLQETHTVGPRSRYNIWANTRPGLEDTAFSTRLDVMGDLGVVAERAMWWSRGNWHEGHVSGGVNDAGTMWVVPGGQQGGVEQYETYVLVANVGTTTASVKVDVVAEDGTTASLTEEVAAQSRSNIVIAHAFPEMAGKRFGVVVTSVGTTPAPLVVEGSVYGDSAGQSWASGGNAMGIRIR